MREVDSSSLAVAGSMNLQTSPPTAFVLIISSHSPQSPGLDRMTVDFWVEVIAGGDAVCVVCVCDRTSNRSCDRSPESKCRLSRVVYDQLCMSESVVVAVVAVVVAGLITVRRKLRVSIARSTCD